MKSRIIFVIAICLFITFYSCKKNQKEEEDTFPHACKVISMNDNNGTLLYSFSYDITSLMIRKVVYYNGTPECNYNYLVNNLGLLENINCYQGVDDHSGGILISNSHYYYVFDTIYKTSTFYSPNSVTHNVFIVQNGNVVRDYTNSAATGGYYSYQYNAENRVIKKECYNTGDILTSFEEYLYDSRGNNIRIRNYSISGTTPVLSQTIEKSYDEKSLLFVKSIEPDRFLQPGSVNNMIRQVVKNGQGQITSDIQISFTYNDYNYPVVAQYNGTGYSGQSYTYGYKCD